MNRRLDFDKINRAALMVLPAIVARLLPDGKATAGEWTAHNPRRADKRLGSFKINLRTCKWSDFATGDKGGDPVSLVAYLEGVTQGEAARLLSHMLGMGGANGR